MVTAKILSWAMTPCSLVDVQLSSPVMEAVGSSEMLEHFPEHSDLQFCVEC
jgi:hypothetical protein